MVFWQVLRETTISEIFFVCGNKNVHVGKDMDGYHSVHGCSRNMEGELLLKIGPGNRKH
jgi:hypothetical protein